MSLDVEKNYDEVNEKWDVELIGELDINTKSQLNEELLNLLVNKEADFKMNCKQLEYIDSTGLGMLIGFYKELSKCEKKMYFINLKPSINNLFTITGFDKIFSISN